MPPKKGTKPKANDKTEYKGPNVYKELLTKQVPELAVDMMAPIEVILNECVEF